MKIEMGESLFLSWLRHVKSCQIVQMNWKPSGIWQRIDANEMVIQSLMKETSELFRTKYQCEVFNANDLDQLIKQAEIDVLGIAFENFKPFVYAIDVAVHEAGLNYGSPTETAMRVAKKIIRSAIGIYAYFGFKEGEIIFATPKANTGYLGMSESYLSDAQTLVRNAGLDFKIRLVANGEFRTTVLQPVIEIVQLVADTSELFMRSLQLNNMFLQGDGQKGPVLKNRTLADNLDGLNGMKIGVLVRTELTRMFENGEVHPTEIQSMLTSEYSKRVFNIRFPLLCKPPFPGETPYRYWRNAVDSHGGEYFVCSQWLESHRPYFLKWLQQR